MGDTLNKAASDNLIAKIQKLLALANNNANEHEAASAAAKVQELLAAHNLSMAEIQQNQKAAGTAVDGPAPRAKETLDLSAMYEYQRSLMAAVAKNNFCLHFIQERDKEDPRAKSGRRRVRAHFLIGSEVNVLACRIMYEYLISTMDRLLPWQGMEKRGKNALLWLAGCSDRLAGRLRASREQAERASAAAARADEVASRHPGAPARQPGSGLVVLADVHGSEADLNIDAHYGWELGTTARNRAEREARQAAWDAEYYLPENVERRRLQNEAQAEKWLAENPQHAQEPKPETEAQKRRRLEQEERTRQRWNEQYDRRQRKAQEKFESTAYKMGTRTGADIGLDQQVGEDRKGRIR